MIWTIAALLVGIVIGCALGAYLYDRQMQKAAQFLYDSLTGQD